MTTTLESAKRYFDDLKEGCNNLISCEELFKSIGAKDDMPIESTCAT